MSEAVPSKSSPDSEEPCNELERALLSMSSGEIDKDAFLRIFLSSQLYILIDGEPVGNTLGNRRPMVIASSPAAPRMLALFSSPMRASKMSDLFEEFKHTVMVDCLWAIHCAGPSTGIAFNPGSALGFELAAQGVQELKRSLEQAP